MDRYEEIASEIIDDVCDVFLEEYPDIPVKKEFLEECEEAHHLYGECYYNLEARIADKLREIDHVAIEESGNIEPVQW